MKNRKYYDIIYADPPWKQLKGGLRKARKNQTRFLEYPTLSIPEIYSLMRQFESRILFLWTIDKFLFEAEQLMLQLGYKLHARIVWNKLNGVAPAFTVRFCHEYLLWGYTSPMLKISPTVRGKFGTVIDEKATKHSKKPEKGYRFIEDLYPNSTKIELFARNRREGWDSWGNEV